MTAVEMLIFRCANCDRQAMACPECVNVVYIDPETGLPPDVRIVNGEAVTIVPAEGARERSEKQPLCDDCVALAIASGKKGMMTADERHRRLHKI